MKTILKDLTDEQKKAFLDKIKAKKQKEIQDKTEIKK